MEWAIRARCDQAEMLLRLDKAKEAQALTASFLTDALLAKSRYRDQGRYEYGFASVLLKEYPAAEQALTLAVVEHLCFLLPSVGIGYVFISAQTLSRSAIASR